MADTRRTRRDSISRRTSSTRASARARRIGLIVLATDQTIEHEWRQIMGGLKVWPSTRAGSGTTPDITPETLRAMEGRLAASAAVIMPGPAVGGGGLRLHLGRHGDRRGAGLRQLREARPEATAAPRRSPPPSRRSGPRRQADRRAHALPATTSTRPCAPTSRRAASRCRCWARSTRKTTCAPRASTSPRSGAAAIELGRSPRVDAVFVSCTSLRVAEAAAAIEAALGKPVTSSNHAMAWHALRLAGIADPVNGWGSLLRLPL